jgi:hypothetical protein
MFHGQRRESFPVALESNKQFVYVDKNAKKVKKFETTDFRFTNKYQTKGISVGKYRKEVEKNENFYLNKKVSQQKISLLKTQEELKKRYAKSFTMSGKKVKVH